MSNWFRSLSISRKLLVGFGGGVLGIATIVLIAALVFSSSNDGLGKYRAIARNSNAVGRVQANTLLARMAVKDYLIRDSEQAVKKARERGEAGVELAKEAAGFALDDKDKANLDKAEAKLSEYAATFEEVVKHGDRARAALDDLAKVGQDLVVDLSDDLEEWTKRRDTESLSATSEALEHVFRMRMGIYKYLSAYADDLSESHENHAKAMGFIAKLPEPHRGDLTAKMNAYMVALKAAESAALAKNALVTGKLDVIGPEVAQITEDVKLAYIEQQDTLGPQLVATNERWLAILVVLGIAIALFTVILARLTSGSIIGPVSEMTEVVDAMAEGDFSQRVEVKSQDEIGRLGENMNRMAQDISEVLDAIQSGANTLGASSQQLSAVSEQLLSSSAKTRSDSTSAASAAEQADGNLGTIASASAQMNANVETVSAAAEEMSANMQSIAAAAEEMSETMNIVAASVEEMTASISEVSNNASASSQLSGEAMAMTETAAKAMSALREHSDEIGKVTDAIKSIADQTNLLALNATIEAASAGASGRGFAVVASEVKALAVQSGQAADDIAERIAQVQASTRAAADAMGKVAGFVERVNQSVDSIASAVEQQNGAAAEISQSVAQSSQGAQEIARNVAEATQGAGEVARTISELNLASRQVSQSSSEAAQGVSSVSMALVQVRDVAAQNDEGSKQVSEAANDLATVASSLQERVQRFRFSHG